MNIELMKKSINHEDEVQKLNGNKENINL